MLCIFSGKKCAREGNTVEEEELDKSYMNVNDSLWEPPNTSVQCSSSFLFLFLFNYRTRPNEMMFKRPNSRPVRHATIFRRFFFWFRLWKLSWSKHKNERKKNKIENVQTDSLVVKWTQTTTLRENRQTARIASCRLNSTPLRIIPVICRINWASKFFPIN